MEIQVFSNAELGEVRTTVIDGEVMFVGKDVAEILGYQNGSRDINRHVDEEDRHKVMLFDGNQDKETIIINESGLYNLILSSKMPNAKKFKRWVTAEVLPEYCDECIYYGSYPHPYKGWTEQCELCHQSMDDDGEEGWCYDGNTRPTKCPLMEVEDGNSSI